MSVGLEEGGVTPALPEETALVDDMVGPVVKLGAIMLLPTACLQEESQVIDPLSSLNLNAYVSAEPPK